MVSVYLILTCVAVLNRFQAVPGSDVIVGADDIEVLQVLTSDLISCLHGNPLRDVTVML